MSIAMKMNPFQIMQSTILQARRAARLTKIRAKDEKDSLTLEEREARIR